MEFRKLEGAILEIVFGLFETKGKDLANLEVMKKLAKKCTEISRRQTEFVVKEHFLAIESEHNPDDLSLTNLDLVKKHLKAMDDTVNNYYSTHDDLEKLLNSPNGKLPPSLMEKLILKLRSMQDYEPEFVLNIRDISLDSWKESLDFEKIIGNERKRFEAFVVKLDNKWRNRNDFLKCKTGTKILKLEQELEKLCIDKDLIRENLSMWNEEIMGILAGKKEAEEEFENLIRKAGFKDLKGVLVGIKKIEIIKSKCQSQVEATQKELKMIRGKLATSMSKQEEYKKNCEKLEGIGKELENSIEKVLEFTRLSGNEKNSILACVVDKNFYKLNEAFRTISERITRDENSEEISLTRNTPELKAVSPAKSSQKIVKKQTKPQMKRIISSKNIEDSQVSDSFITEKQVSRKNEAKKDLISKNNSKNDPKKEVNSKSSPKKSESTKIIIPTIKEEHMEHQEAAEIETPNLKKKFPREKKAQLVEKKSMPSAQTERKAVSIASPEKKIIPPPLEQKATAKSPKVAGLSSKSSKKSRHFSLEPPIHKDLLETPKFKSAQPHQLNVLISDIFSNQMLKSPLNLNYLSENVNIAKMINQKEITDLMEIELVVAGQKRTLQELFIENLQNLLKSEKNEINWESVIEEKQSSKEDSEENLEEMIANKVINEEKPEKVGWRTATLRLFILLEDYLEKVESGQYRTVSELIYEKMSQKKRDEIVDYIGKTQDLKHEISEISALMTRRTKYELLFKIFAISKSHPYHDWKSDKLHVINKVRWSNLLKKAKKNLQNRLRNPMETPYRAAIESLNKRKKLLTVESFENFNNKHKHNHSMENIALTDLSSKHNRNISLHQKGLNYFLPQLQHTPRVIDKSFQALSSNFIYNELWVKNSNKKL